MMIVLIVGIVIVVVVIITQTTEQTNQFVAVSAPESWAVQACPLGVQNFQLCGISVYLPPASLLFPGASWR